MTSGSRVALGVAIGLAAAIGAAGCSSGSKTGSENFVGTWIYAGMIDPNCGTGSTIPPFDLTGQSVTITATNSSHITVALPGLCTVMFNVDGFMATAQSGQSCTFNLGGTLGQQPVAITKWTLTSTTTDTITSDVSGSAFGGVCTPAGTGTLTRVGDAGTTD